MFLRNLFFDDVETLPEVGFLFEQIQQEPRLEILEGESAQHTLPVSQPFQESRLEIPGESSAEILQEVVHNLSQNRTSQVGQGSSNEFFSLQRNSFNENGSMKIFENELFEVFMIKSFHKSQRNFKFEDAMFQIKIKMKDNITFPMIKDILEVLQSIINFALQSLQTYINPALENICYLTIFQNPMIRGVKSAPFNLSENPETGTANLLGKLNRYLVSNNELTLNESFILYVNILSLTHAQMQKRKRRKIEFGANTSEFRMYWCIDVLSSVLKSFKNKCLLLCCILADLQFKFFLSNKSDKRYTYAANINSTLSNKKSQAIGIFNTQLSTIITALKINNSEFECGLDFSKWKEKLCEYFNCQIVIFTGKEFSSKILLMHPPLFDHTLRQFYFYSPNQQPNHVVFIRHLNSYFKANIFTCIACKKTFKTHDYRHLCKEKENCFACRRPVQKLESFFCPTLQDAYCDKLLTKEKLEIECIKCNLLLETELCFKSHQKICGKKGRLGYKCKKCDNFFYKNGTEYKNSNEIAEKHTCGEVFCRHCKLYYSFSDNKHHLCRLKKEFLRGSEESLVFLTFSVLQNSAHNCLDCYERQNTYVTEKNISYKELFFDVNFSKLLCTSHKDNWFAFEPNAICMYKQNSENAYIKYEMSDYKKLLKEEIFFQQNIPYKKPKKTKITEDFKLILNNLENLKCEKAITIFLKTILSLEWCNYTVILSDPFGFFLKKLTTELINLGICPKLINDIGKVILLEISQIKLRFVTTEMYHLDTKFDEIIIKEKSLNEHFFPNMFNRTEHYTYIGLVPDNKYFIELSDSSNIANKKRLFVENYKDYIWNFQEELSKNLNYKCNLLTLKCTTFVNDCLSLQRQLQTLVKNENPNKNHELNPFHNSLCSFSAFIYKLFKAYFLFDEEIYSIIDEYGLYKKNFSRDEILWAQYMTFEHKEKQFRHQFNHPKGQKYFTECIPDLYSPVTEEVWFFNGCYWHGHSVNECLRPSKTGFNQSQNKSFETLNNEFTNKIKKFKAKYPNSEVFCTWECEFAKIKQTLPFLKFKFSGQSFHPYVRLRPRTTIKGGYNQVYRFNWCKEDNPNESFFCLDINGLYSFCAINFPTNVGKYDILIGNELDDITYQNNKIFYKGKKIFGAIQVTILPPQNLFLPFLMYKTENGKNVLTLCKTCSEKNSQFVTPCNHSNEERAFTSCYMIPEIEFALTLGYKILHLFEIHAYYSRKCILGEFVKCLDSLKLKHSDFSNCLMDSKSLCEKINSELKLPESFSLKPKDLETNEFKKSLYKIAANSLFGKLQQRSDYNSTKFIASQYELEEIYRKYEENVFNITCHNDNICQVDYYEKLTSKTRNLKQNCYMGAEITSNARIVLYNHLSELNKTEIKLYYCDTDSIFGTTKNQNPVPLKIGDLNGEFKHVVKGEILSFYCLGLKNYCLTYKNEIGEKKSITKLCGLNLNNCAINNAISDSLYKSYLINFFKGHQVNQTFPKIKRPRLNQPSFLETFTLNNNISSDRQINVLSKISFPCGYN